MSPDRETRLLRDMRFAADLRRQFEDLARRTSPPRESILARAVDVARRNRWLVGVAAATAVAAGLILVGVPGVSRVSGPPSVSAAQVMSRMLLALSSGETLQADSTAKWLVAVVQGGANEYFVVHERVLLRSDGSYRFTQMDKPQTSRPVRSRNRMDAEDTAYDAAHGVLRYYVRGWDPGAGLHGSYLNRFEVTTGYPLGPPDSWTWGPAKQRDFSAMARALQAGDEATLETTSYQGRPVWVISISTRGVVDPYLAEDEVSLTTVDQQTCLPTRFQLLVDGVLQFEYSWRNVRINEPLPESAFTFAPPKGAKVVRKDAGFRRLPLTRIASAADNVTLLPAWLPVGYAQKWAAAARKATTANGLTEGRNVVAVQYVRGFDGLTVTTRAVAHPEIAAEVDPVEDDTAWANFVRRDVHLTAGAFAGVTARIVMGPRITTPHLYAVKNGVLLTVAGGATAKELIAIAESLETYRPETVPSASALGGSALHAQGVALILGRCGL